MADATVKVIRVTFFQKKMCKGIKRMVSKLAV